MNKIIMTILLLGVAVNVSAGDFICGEDQNISKRISCGRKCSVNPQCIRASRETSIINKKLKDGKLIDLTTEELDAIALAKTLAEEELKKQITIDKLVAVLESKSILTKVEVEDKEISSAEEISK